MNSMVSPHDFTPDPERSRGPDLGGSLFGLSSRVPPSSMQAEQALLGALLANNKAYDRVSDFLLPDHFADPIHGRIYEAIRARIQAGRLADVVTLRTEFENAGTLSEAGGAEYLAQLLSAMVGVINAGEYGRLIYDCWIRRQLIDVGEVLVNRAFGAEPGLASEMAVSAAGVLLDLAHKGGQALPTLSELTEAVLIEAEEARAAGGRVTRGIPTGHAGLDDLLGLLQPSHLYVFAGRPGMGKSVLAGMVTMAAAKAGYSVGSFQLEMGGVQVMRRIIAAEAGISMTNIKRGWLSQAEMNRLVEARGAIGALALQVDDTPGLTVEDVRARCRAMSRKRPLDLVVVDYLGLIQPPKELRRFGVTTGMEHVSNKLKELAKELQCPVVALHQLNRGVESREDKRPGLSDLRWSGAIEQDADVVGFLYREEYYLENARPSRRPDESDQKFADRETAWQDALDRCRGQLDIIVGKHRDGPCGTIKARFDGATSRIWMDPEAAS